MDKFIAQLQDECGYSDESGDISELIEYKNALEDIVTAMRARSIPELWSEISSHPDFAGGTVFTRDDVAEVAFEPEDGWDEDAAVPVDAVTPRMLELSVDAIDNFIFSGAWSWRDAVRENIDADRVREAALNAHKEA